jgi:hypothetical protein
LLQIVRALRAAGRFASRLDRRKQKRYQNANDGDNNKYLNQSESATHLISNRGECSTH